MCSCSLCEHQALALQELRLILFHSTLLKDGCHWRGSHRFFSASIHKKKQPATQKPSLLVSTTGNKENEPIIEDLFVDPCYPLYFVTYQLAVVYNRDP